MADERTTTFKGDPLVLVGPELKAGDQAPDFELTGNDLSAVSLSQTSGTRIFSVVPSLDTPVCDQQTRRFNEEAAGIGDVTIGDGTNHFRTIPDRDLTNVTHLARHSRPQLANLSS